MPTNPKGNTIQTNAGIDKNIFSISTKRPQIKPDVNMLNLDSRALFHKFR